MAKQQQRVATGRRPRTTSIMVAVPTTLKAVSDLLGIPAPTVTARYHALQDRYPRSVITLDALAKYRRARRS